MRYDKDKRRLPVATQLHRDLMAQTAYVAESIMNMQGYLNSLGNLLTEVGELTGAEFEVVPDYTTSTAQLAHAFDEDQPQLLRTALDKIEEICAMRLLFKHGGNGHYIARGHHPQSGMCFYVTVTGMAHLALADRLFQQEAA